jgi:hypothetical protein
MTLPPRAVIVYRTTEFDELLSSHGTRAQAAFFLETRGRTLDEVEARHNATHSALARVSSAVPIDWRRGQVERKDLSRFVFGPEDVVVAVGQDGLVANVAKYLDAQPVVGVNPDRERNPGVLVAHQPGDVRKALAAAADPANSTGLTMVQARLDDGQSLRALNEIYVGHPSHQSARYRLRTPDGREERHSSSGVLVGSGTGATGWCRSVWLERGSSLHLPAPEDETLCWFAREAWPSPATGADLTEGLLSTGEELTIVAESDLVLFGDGIESDTLTVSWGQHVVVSTAANRLKIVGRLRRS